MGQFAAQLDVRRAARLVLAHNMLKALNVNATMLYLDSASCAGETLLTTEEHYYIDSRAAPHRLVHCAAQLEILQCMAKDAGTRA